MGRYVFFDTGIDYKFRFGVQQSEDILIYGGKTFADEETLFQKWTHNDNNSIMYILNNIEDENFQKTLSHDNNQIGSKSKLGKPLIPSLRLGNKGNNLGKNGSQEGILKINFDLQHKELSEQRRTSGKL